MRLPTLRGMKEAASPAAARVVVVEDDPRFRVAFAAAIAQSGDLLLHAEAATLREGLAWLEGPPADVLLTDLGLPDGSGIELIRAARVAWPMCHVMVVSVFGDETHVLQAIAAGAAGYLLKDSAADNFVDQIRSVLAGGSPISPLIARHLLLRFQAVQPVPPRAAPDNDQMLSRRESEVLNYIAKGFNFEEVARLMVLSRHTVLTYVRRIYAKLEVRSKTEAMHEARKLGLLRD
jgi:DNA-binding NarL/FixJ family response regulator